MDRLVSPNIFGGVFSAHPELQKSESFSSHSCPQGTQRSFRNLCSQVFLPIKVIQEINTTMRKDPGPLFTNVASHCRRDLNCSNTELTFQSESLCLILTPTGTGSLHSACLLLLCYNFLLSFNCWPSIALTQLNTTIQVVNIEPSPGYLSVYLSSIHLLSIF